jgi:hypothetical protein
VGSFECCAKNCCGCDCDKEKYIAMFEARAFQCDFRFVDYIRVLDEFWGRHSRTSCYYTTRSHTRGHESIRLSIFNPEEENARDWITDNERAKKMYGWDEYETIHRVSSYLVGEALEWFKRWKISDRKWSNFIIELRCSF